MIDILIGCAGAAFILLVATDVFRSLLVPRASAGRLRLGPIVSRGLFPLWQAISDRIPDRNRRQTLRASLAPLMLVLLLMIWAALLIFGFGLMLWADRAGFEPKLATFNDALYASGSAFSTLGVGGSVTGHFARLAVVACSLAGLAIVTVVATFLISIQSGFGRREALVLRLEAHVTLPPSGIAILETYAREDIIPRLGAFFENWEAWAAEVAISHRAFPILLFFRSNDSRCEWLAALGAVLDAAALLDATLADAPPGVRAGAHFVLRTGTRLVCDLSEQFARPSNAPTELVDADRFHLHRQRLQDAGYAVGEDADAALARYSERRASYAAALGAVARRLRIDVDERRAGDEDGGPLP